MLDVFHACLFHVIVFYLCVFIIYGSFCLIEIQLFVRTLMCCRDNGIMEHVWDYVGKLQFKTISKGTKMLEISYLAGKDKRLYIRVV